MFGSLGRAIGGAIGSTMRAAKSVVGAVNKVPILGAAARAVPGVGTALSLGSAALSVGSMIGGGGGSRSAGLPALPGAAGLPALPGSMGGPAIVGQRKIFRNDANVPDALKPFTISKGDLRQYYRSPLKGYVIRYDQNGDPYAVPKHIARQYLGWRPAKKPPISVGEHEALKRADRTVKKVRKIMAMVSRVDKSVGAGGKVIIHRKKKGGH